MNIKYRVLQESENNSSVEIARFDNYQEASNFLSLMDKPQVYFCEIFPIAEEYRVCLDAFDRVDKEAIIEDIKFSGVATLTIKNTYEECEKVIAERKAVWQSAEPSIKKSYGIFSSSWHILDHIKIVRVFKCFSSWEEHDDYLKELNIKEVI